MTSLIAFAESTAMATTQLARVIRYQDAASWRLESTGERKPRMSWVVVTDNDGGRRLRILWS
ncbi:MAG: hypothetical protein ACHP9V_02600 [Terriglobales bacterium]